jgi:hypothetical protein
MPANDAESFRGGPMECLCALQSASRRLKDSLLKRDPNAIAAAVEEQEKMALHLRGLRDSRVSFRATEGDETKRETAVVTESIKRELRASRILAASFLGVIDKTIADLSARAGSGVVTYDSSGSMESRGSALLIQQTG